ncbi:MAG: hypothetical protein OHK93_003374 [Ramalina farinacea]|uniref:Uncharacterized protein n=1 Tax=Ramalina farinacea TaxID=258253 RepID=A0AA43QTF6_9LECA|nr:hypothetical protein [Ramalina farinacea]
MGINSPCNLIWRSYTRPSLRGEGGADVDAGFGDEDMIEREELDLEEDNAAGANAQMEDAGDEGVAELFAGHDG